MKKIKSILSIITILALTSLSSYALNFPGIGDFKKFHIQNSSPYLAKIYLEFIDKAGNSIIQQKIIPAKSTDSITLTPDIIKFQKGSWSILDSSTTSTGTQRIFNGSPEVLSPPNQPNFHGFDTTTQYIYWNQYIAYFTPLVIKQKKKP